MIDDADVAQLIGSCQSTWNHLPTREALTGILQNYVQKETLFKESLRRGPEKNLSSPREALQQQP